MKLCNKCQETKDNSCFYSLGGARSHLLQSWCKDCVKARASERGIKKSPNAKQNSKRYQEKNREVCAKRSRSWYKKNKKEVSEKQSKYNKTPQRRSSKRIHNQNYLNQKRKTANGSVTFNALLSLFATQGGRCAECSKKIDLKAKRYSETACELDHIYPISRGGLHIISNVQWLCASCNKHKWAHIPTEIDKISVQ